MAGPSLAALIESQLPDFVVEDYPLVTNFLSKYYEALSISEGPQDILNNFERYLDVDTFSPEILVKTASLDIEIPLGNTNIDITVDSTDGFPDTNGMIMIDQEIFLYESKTDTIFWNCVRGYSAKTKVGDLYEPINFVESVAAVHKQFAVVNNLSNLLLAALIKNYEEQYTSGFPYPYLRDQTNKNLLVKKIKDFYNVKGTPQSLEFIFQMLFSVKPDIIYPKENVYKASESGWNNKELLVCEVISGDIRKIVGNEIIQSPDPYNPELTAASAIIDNIVGEPYQGSLQYTLTISPGSKSGIFAIARRSFLMNDISTNAGLGDRIDVFSTVGFPERDGRVIIGNEEITYSSKTATQFIIKERDAVNSDNKQLYSHAKGVRAFTKNNLSGFYTENGVRNEIELRIYGLVSGLTSQGIEPEASSGLEYDETADNYFDVASGGIPYVSFNNMVEFKASGFSDDLPLTNEWIVNQNFSKLSGSDPSNVGTNNIKDKILSDVTAIYRDTDNYYIASSGFPSYAIGPFDNISVPEDQEHLKIIPREPVDASAKEITTSTEVGVMVNGVPLLNHKSTRGLDFGLLERIDIIDRGRNYSLPPQVVISGNATAEAQINGIGEVISVNITNQGSGYTTAPTVEFTSGSGGEFTVLIQQGEIANIYLSVNQNAEIIDAGSNYTEPPDVFIYDASGKGKGAFYTCQIDTATGKITGFTKQSGGFDYNDSSTTITLVPKARSASATAVLTRWQYNRYLEMSVDNGNAGGIVENANDPNYGYSYGHIIAPTSLKILRQDNVDGQGNPLSNNSHSPILGWAYDGNPIYGSFGYEDSYQDVTAPNPTLKRMVSSWRLKASRGSNAPDTNTYSLGRFTNDYEFIERLGTLDANNGRFCTTPEFPNGVYAYFLTTDDSESPTFPYSIGEAFYNVPVEENWKTKSKQKYLPDGVRRRTVNATADTGELLTSRVSGIEYGPITDVEVHQSSFNFTNEDVLYVDNSINDNGDGLFAAVDQIQGQQVASLSCNTPKNNYFTCDRNVYLNHNSQLTQNNTGAIATVIGLIEETSQFVVKNVTGNFNLTDTVDSTTEIYNITFDNTVLAAVGDEVVYTVNAGGVAHEVAIGRVLRNVVDKNTVIVELKAANPNQLTTVDGDGNTVTIPSTSYVDLGFFAVGNGCQVNVSAATIVNVRSLSKGFKLLEVEDNIAVLRTDNIRHGLAVGDDVIVTVEPDSSISTQKYYVETKKYHTVQLNEPTKVSQINGSGIARVNIINAGSGFTPSTTFNGINVTNSSGTGSAGTLTVTTDAGGHVVSAAIITKGDGYEYGNVVTIQSSLLGGNVNSQEATFFVDAAGCAKTDTIITVTSGAGYSRDDIIKITDEECQITNVTGNFLTVIRGVNGTEAEDHIEGVDVTLITNYYRFTKDSNVSFSGNNAWIDSYDPETHKLIVYYINEGDTIIDPTSTFLDGSTPNKQVSISTVEPTSLRFRFKKDGETEWNRNISIECQKTYRYLFDTSDPSLVNRNLKFYENVYRTTELVQSYQSTIKPGNTGSFSTFQLGYGIPVDGTTWTSTPVLDIPTKIYYGEVSGKIDAEEKFFTLVEDPFAGKHAVFYGYEYEFAYRLAQTPQNEGFTNVQYYTDSLYAVGAIKRVKVISGGKNYTMPPQVPGVFLNKRFRGAFTVNITEGRITSITVTDTGLNYSKPVVLLENKGEGANAKFTIELRADGSVSRIIPVQEGISYADTTTLRLYESDTKLFAQGTDIGKLATLEIISSGKDFNNDPTLAPQVNPPIVMTLRDMPDKAFLNGELITQRNLAGDMIASGRVDYWVDGMNILRLKGIYGKFDSRYQIYGETLRATASIQVIYVANITPQIGPTSTSVGSYSSDRSKLSAVSQKVQDGVYYQDYSYVVKSTVSINDWRDFVKRFTHPAGFNLFGEVLIESEGDAKQPATIDTPQSGTKDNGYGAVMSIIEPGVLGVTCAHKSRRITQSHVRVDSMSKQRGTGTINYSEQNNVEIEVFDLAISPAFDGAVQADGTITGTTQFTLFKKDINEVLVPFRATQLVVTLDGVLQDPDTAYTVAGSTITFASAPLGPYTDPSTGIFVPGVTFYGKSMKFQDDANNAEYMREANNITSQFDGTTVEFDLGIPIVDGDHLYVSLDGVIQEPDVAFTLTTNPGNGKITFTEPPRQVGKIVELEIGDATNWLVNDYVVGQTSGARGEIVAKRYFSDNRFLDAANIIDNNASVLAEEAVFILDNTSKFAPEYFQYPGLGRNQCIVDLKSVLRAMADDLIQGGNSNTFDAAKEYLLDPSDPNSGIKHIEGEVEATLWSMKYLKDMVILAIRNKFGIGNLYDYQRAAASDFRLQPTDATYSAASGTLVLTIPNHELTTADFITIADNSMTWSCDMDGQTSDKTYPRQGDPAYRSTLDITQVTDDTVTVNVGTTSNITHTPTDGSYDPVTGLMELIIGSHNLSPNTAVKIAPNSLSFKCEMDYRDSVKTYPRTTDPFYDKAFNIVSTGSTFHTAETASYNPTTGIVTIQITDHGFEAGDNVKLADGAITFSCTYGGGVHNYVGGTATNAVTVTGGASFSVTDASYNPSNGDLSLTIGAHSLTIVDTVTIDTGSLVFRCDEDNFATDHSYPRATDPVYNLPIAIKAVGGTSITVNVGVSSPGSAYPRSSDPISGKFIPISNVTSNTFDIQCLDTLPSSNLDTHTFVSALTNGVELEKGKIILQVGQTPLVNHDVSDATYDPVTGDMELTIGAHTLATNTSIKLRDSSLIFSCTHGSGNKSYPRPDTYSHTATTGTSYNPVTGEMLVTTTAPHDMADGDWIKFEDNSLTLSCTYGAGNHTYVGGTAIDAVSSGGSNFNVIGADYNFGTGVLILTIGTHSLTTSDTITIAANSLSFTCDADNNATVHPYPRTTDPVYNTAIAIDSVDATTITVNVGVGSNGSAKTYPRTGDYPDDRWLKVSNVTTDTFIVTVLDAIPSTNIDTHVFVSATTDGIKQKKDPFHDTAINIKSVTSTSITINILNVAPSTNVTPHTFVDALPGAVISGGGYSHKFIGAAADCIISGGNYAHTFKSALSNSIGVYADPYNIDNPVANTFIDAAKLIKDNKTFVAEESVARMATGNLRSVTAATYTPVDGLLTMNIGPHSFTTGELVQIPDGALTFNCTMDGNSSPHIYPRSTDPASGKNLSITATTSNEITVNVGVATSGQYDHTFVSAATPIKVGVGIIADPYYDDAAYIKYEGTPLTATNAVYAPDTGVVQLTVPTHQFTVTDAAYSPASGDMQLTIGTHSLTCYDKIKLATDSISFSCEYNGATQTKTYPRAAGANTTSGADYAYDTWLPVLKKDATTITVNVNGGQGTISHNFPHTFQGAGASGVTTYGHGLTNGDYIKLMDHSLTFTCAEDGNQTTHPYPRSTDPISDKWVEVSNVTTDTFEIQCLTTIPSSNETAHTFVSAYTNGIIKQDGVIVTNIGKSSNDSPHQFVTQVGKTPTNAVYTPNDGKMVLTIADHGYTNGDWVKLDIGAVTFRCDENGQADDHAYPRAISDMFTADTGTTYDPSTGVLSVRTTVAHNLSNGDWIKFDDGALTFTCLEDTNSTQHPYPRYTDYPSNRWLEISNATGNAFDVTVLDMIPSTNVTDHTFVSGVSNAIKHKKDWASDGWFEISNTSLNNFEITVNTTVPSSNTTNHVFQSALPNSVKKASLITGGSYTHTFDRALDDAITVNTGAKFKPTDVAYDASTGDMVLTLGSGHAITTSNTVTILANSIIMRCAMDANETPHSYPRVGDPAYGRSIVVKSVDTTTITVHVGKSQPLPYEPSILTYDPATGDMLMDIGTHRLGRHTGFKFFPDTITLTCGMDNHATTHTYPRASSHDALGDCVDDVKDILEAIVWNLQYGGNNKVWDAADLFIDRDGYLEHIQHSVPEVLNVMGHLKTILANIIRNNTVNAVGTHGLIQVKDPSITKESNECAQVESAVDTFVGLIENAVQNPTTFESGVTRTIPERWPIVYSSLTANRDLTITVDSMPQCAQVESAVNTLFSIVLNTIKDTAFNNKNYLMTITQDFPNPNRIQVEMSKKEFLNGEDIQSEASLAIANVGSTAVISPGVQQKFFGFKHGKYYKMDTIEPQFNDAQTIFELERGGVPFYAERSQNVVVILNGVIQQNRIAYRIEDNIIVFQEAPSEGSECFILYFYGLDPERVLLGFNIEPEGTFKKFFRLTVDQQIVLPLEGADCWISTDPNGGNHTYEYSYARGRIYKQNWAPGARNLLFVEGVTGQKVNWLNGTLSLTRDRGASASLLDVTVNAVEETTNSDLREKLFNRQDRLPSTLKSGDFIQIDGEADTRSIIRAAREALVTSGYDSDTTVGSFFRSYEYEVVINVGAYSGQIEGDGAQAVARIDAELRYHSLTSSRQAGVEFLPNDVVCQYNDQNDVNSGIVWQGTVKNYIPARKTLELYSLYLDGSGYTDPVSANFRPGEKVYINNVAGTECTGLQYLKPGGVNSIVLSKRDNSTYFDNVANWRLDNVLNKGENLLGAGFIPANASANDISQEYDYSSSIYDSDLQPQISKNYREPPVMIFRSQPEVDANGDPVGAPAGGGARANAITVRGEIGDTEIISGGSGYKVPPQILFTRGYFVIRRNPLDIKNLTTFGIEPPTLDATAKLHSYLSVIKKGGAQTTWAQWAAVVPYGVTLVFGNAGSSAYLLNRTYDPVIHIRKIIDLQDLSTKRQPQILVELKPEQTSVQYLKTNVTNTQCTGGVQGVSVAVTKYKFTETKLTAQSGAIEKQAGTNPQMKGVKETFSPGNLGPHLNYLQSFKFEIQPQSTTNNNGYYTDGMGRTIQYIMGDMNIGWWSEKYPNLTIEDFDNPEVYNSQVNDPGDTNNFVYMQGSEVHFGTKLTYSALDNPNGSDTILVDSTAGFPASGGSFIIGSAADQTKVEKITYTQAFSDRFVGCTRVNPLGVVEKGFSAYDFNTTNVGASVVSGGTVFDSNINYLLFSGTSGARSATFAPTDLTTYNTVTFSAIRGDGSNGGNAPGSAVNDLMLSYSIDGGTTFIDIGSVVTYSQANYTNWNTITQNIPSNAQTATTIIRIYMANSTNMTSDQYGVRLMWFNDANTDSYIAGDYIITADLDL